MILQRTSRGSMLSRYLLVLSLSLVAAAPAFAQRGRDDIPKNSAKVVSAFREVVAAPSDSTVHVLSLSADEKDIKELALGTVVGADGWILTKASELKGHVVCKLKDGTNLDARIIGIQDKYDLALLKIEAKGLKPVVWGDSKTALPGNWVAAPGSGKDPIAVGVISVAVRKVSPQEMHPVSNNSGYLGVGLEAAETLGAKINQVMENTAAAKAGLKPNDVVIAIGDKTVTDDTAMMKIIQRYKPGDSVVLHVKRDDQEIEIKAVLGKRPLADGGRADFQNSLGSKLSERRGGFPIILQHDTVLKPNECGGPLVDLDGKTVGINIARAGRVETYAIPAEEALALLPELKSGKLAPKDTLLVNDVSDAVKKAREALKNAEAELAAMQKKTNDAEKKVFDLKKALEKVEADSKKFGK